MRRRRQAGQALVLASFGITVFMLAAGLAIDMGYLRYQKRRMQSAADSAAIAGAAELNYGDVTCAANVDSSDNGFTDSTAIGSCSGATSTTGTATVTVSCSTGLQGPFGACNSAASGPYVQVIVSQQEPLFFMHIIPNITLPTVSAKAIAALGSANPGCMYALGTNGGITAGGPAASAMDIEAENCAVLTDGPLTVANDIVKFIHAEGIGYVGAYDGGAGNPYIVPAPQQVAPVADPLAYLQTEIPSGGGTGSCSGGNGSVITCTPGSYPSGITITASKNNVIVSGSFGSVTSSGPAGSSSLNVSFSPGFYSLGGNLTIVGSTTTGDGTINGMVTGYSVTFYTYGSAALAINAGTNASGPYTADYALSCSGAGGQNTFNMWGFYTGEQVQFSAPADSSNGGLPGVLYIQDQNDTSTSSITLANGDGMDSPGVWDSNGCAGPFGNASTTSYMWGAIYAHSTSYNTITNLDGIGLEADNMCASLPRFTEVVSDALNPTNNINIGVNDCASPPTQYQATDGGQPLPNPIKDAALVE